MSEKVFEETGFFNIYNPTVEIKESINERAPLGPDPTNETDESVALRSKSLYRFSLPLLAGRTIMLPEYVNHLKDHHIIKRALKEQEDEEMNSGGGGGSIFDDFFGMGPKKETKKETTKKKAIDIDENLMIETISNFYCHQGYSILSLVLSFEHKETKFS
jgi:hypothetical protein